MNELVKIVPAKNPYVSLVWQVSDLCNFRCSYCSEYNWGGKFKNNQTELITKNLKKILDYYKELGYTNFKIFFSGGEPSYWKPLMDVVNFCKSELPEVKFAINTNLSRELSWWQENHSHFDDIICSYHVEGADPQKFIETYNFLKDKTNYLVARMMMHEERFDEVVEFSKKFKSETSEYRLEYVPLFRELSNKTEPWHYKEERKREFFKDHSYEMNVIRHVPPRSKADTSSREIYKDGSTRDLNSNRLVAERKNFFKGWQCFVHESVFIGVTGDISLATCGQAKPVGNLFAGEFSLDFKSIICDKQQCHCGTDIYITKHHPDFA